MAGSVDVIDRDLEARRHLWRGLPRMPPAERVAFLRHACAGFSAPGGVGVQVTGHTGTTGEAFADLINLGAVYGVDLYGVCEQLETWLRKRGC